MLYGNNDIYAIEVKNSLRIRTEDLRPLKAFQQDYPESKCLLLYRGHEKLCISDILCIPCEQFLKELVPNTFQLSDLSK